MSQTEFDAAPPAAQDVQKAGTQSGQHHLVAHRDRRAASLWAASPFGLMRQFSMDIDRLFGEALNAGPPTPQIEVLERDGQLIVRADLPGLSKDDVRVELAEDTLTISGERRVEHDETRRGVHITERQYGRFTRRVPLPEGVNGENAQATFHNGVLEVSIPAPAGQRQGRSIEIKDGPAAAASPPQ